METRNLPPVLHKKKRMPRIVSLIVIGFLIMSIVQFYQNFQRIHNMHDRIYQLKADIEYMKVENEQLMSMLKKMNSDEFIERVAREELGLIRKGEILVITVDEGDE